MPDFKNDPWFSGYCDGEACFHLGKDKARVTMVFVIGARADELPLLQDLQECFGGTLHYTASNRAYHWHVGRRSEQHALVRYFDRFPLRSKKARDYVIWRRALMVVSDRGPRDIELVELRDALMAGRKYEASPIVVPERHEQMKF